MTAIRDCVPDEFEAQLLQAATDYQQNFYEIVSDWNIYQNDERTYLKDFIGYGLFGPPRFQASSPTDVVENAHDFGHFVYEDEKKKTIETIFDKVLEYGTNEQSDGTVLCGIIYNVIFNKSEAQKSLKKIEDTKKITDDDRTEETKENAKFLETMNEETQPQVYPVPVFKVRPYRVSKEKDMNGEKITGDEKLNSAMNLEKIYYIDNGGRVYNGFGDYLANNTLPVCTMVLPKDGRYQADPVFSSKSDTENGSAKNLLTRVWVEIEISPAGRTSAKVLMGGDIASTVVTVATMGVGLAAMVTPIGAGIALASAVGAGVSGLWTVGRCAQQLADRGQHGESINVTDRSALGAWIGIAGGTMGLAATGGTVLLARAVRTGRTVGRAATIVYDAVQIGNLIVNGVGIGYKSYDIYATHSKGETVSAQDVFFLSAHVFFFCNSVINIRLAQNLIESTQGQLLRDYEDTLRSNRHRKEFQRIARNTRAAGSNDVTSNEEIIRAINKIDNRDEFFQAMVRNRKAFSASSAKATFSPNGKVIVNGIMTIDPIEFASLPKNVRADIVKGVTNAQSVNVSTSKPTIPNVGNNQVAYKNFTARSNDVLKEFCVKHSNAMFQSAPVVITDFANVLEDLRNVHNRAEIFVKLLNMGYKILQALPRDVEITLGDNLAFIVQFLWDYVKSNVRNVRFGLLVEDPFAHTFLNELTTNLWCRVEEEIEVWVEAFIRWLKTQFPQSLNGRFLNLQVMALN